MTLKIHFFGLDPSKQTFPIAAALGAGLKAELTGAKNTRFDRLYAEADKRWVASGEEDADLFVYPHVYHPTEEVHAGALKAKSLKVPCLFFESSDSSVPCTPPYGLVYRESILASQIAKQERAMPAFADDLVLEVEEFRILPKKEKPSVGFCGYVGNGWRRAIYRLQGRSAKVLGLELRDKALQLLEQSSGIQTNFIRRKSYWGGAVSRFKTPDPQARIRVREEYLENIMSSDYVLCLRGAGNFSYRFYETLALGKIPLFINTDCALPFGDKIDWRRHCVWIEQEELPQLGEKLIEYHQGISNSDFEQVQKDNRQLWEDYLRPTECYETLISDALKMID